MAMTRRFLLWSNAGAAALLLAAGGGWMLSLPPASPTRTAPMIAKEEADATLAALTPPKRARPVVAIIGINDATEATDYLMPYAGSGRMKG